MLPPLRSLASPRIFPLLWLLVAALPVIYVAMQIVVSSRNIVFWDEFDTALDLILRIDAGADGRELMRRFFALNNEHRTVTSRLLFAASYWFTGTLNFHLIGVIGNLFLVGACTILILTVDGLERRVRMTVVLGFLLFQLEHFESFLWSGASIDHFQVVMLAVGAIAAIARGSRGGLLIAVLLGVLATFTLAQGCMTWPVGGLMLARQRRWNHLATWLVCGALALGAFLQGFAFNPGHNISSLGPERIEHVFRYWLALLGGPLTLGDAGFAPFAGLALLAGLGVVAARGAILRAPVAFFCALFGVGALALVAFGRSEIAGADVNSRYLILGALAWAMLIFLLLELRASPEKPYRLLACFLPALVVFNVSANRKFAPLAESFLEVRDRAATSFMQYGEDGRGITRLHPQHRHADVLLRMAEERGVYRLPRVSHPAEFPDAEANPAIVTHLDELIVNERAVTVGGWAMLPGRVSKRGEIYVILRSPQSSRAFSTITLPRSDVAKAYGEPRWRLCGFRAVIERDRLPAEDFVVGVLIDDGARPDFIMSTNRIELAPGKPATVVRHPVAP